MSRRGVDHLDLVVTDLDRSLAFYTGGASVSPREAQSGAHGTPYDDYTPGYYSVFFYDPDGIKLEIVHRLHR